MTECIQEAFRFAAHFSRRVEAGFTAGHVSSDGGALLLRQAERKIKLLGRLAGCFGDGRKQELIEHTVGEMLSQRIYGLALGYEDLNDHEQLRSDPLLGVLSGKRKLDEPLAGKSTLNRLELAGRTARYHKINYSAEAIDRLLVDLYIESHSAPPHEIVLDLDATDIPLYGHQSERFFHGYYDSYCYLPLYIFAADQLLCARLRPANQDAAAGSVEEVRRIAAQLRQHWPEVKIVLTVFADASFDHGIGIAAFAGWFRTTGSIHRISKVSKRRFVSSNEAELVALCATVLVALRRQASLRDGDFVVAKSDCLYAVEHLKNKTGGATEAERRMVAKVHAALQVHGLRFYVRHVKGHTTLPEPRFHVNRWCDGEARRLLREAVRKERESSPM